MIHYDMPTYRTESKQATQRKIRLMTALIVVMPILSLLAGAAVAAHQYGVL